MPGNLISSASPVLMSVIVLVSPIAVAMVVDVLGVLLLVSSIAIAMMEVRVLLELVNLISSATPSLMSAIVFGSRIAVAAVMDALGVLLLMSPMAMLMVVRRVPALVCLIPGAAPIRRRFFVIVSPTAMAKMDVPCSLMLVGPFTAAVKKERRALLLVSLTSCAVPVVLRVFVLVSVVVMAAMGVRRVLVLVHLIPSAVAIKLRARILASPLAKAGAKGRRHHALLLSMRRKRAISAGRLKNWSIYASAAMLWLLSLGGAAKVAPASGPR